MSQLEFKLESAWSSQHKDGKTGTEPQNISHGLKTGRYWPVMPTTQTQCTNGRTILWRASCTVIRTLDVRYSYGSVSGGKMMDRTALYSFMGRHRYGVVSSISGKGVPQSALVGIATTPNLEIIFDTVKSSRKYPNLIARPVCSFVVGWAGEQTVQLEGVATEPKGPDLKRYQGMYFSVWPDGPARMSWPDIAYLVVRPRWIRYSDYDQIPPVIEEITIDD
jgi:hypothetical protein